MRPINDNLWNDGPPLSQRHGGTGAKIAPNTSTTRKFLVQVGDGEFAQPMELDTLGPDDIPDFTAVEVVATEDIPAFSVVTSKGKVADSGTVSGIEKVIGIAEADIDTGFSGRVTMIGEIDNPAWTFVAGDVIFLNGTSLSTTAPSTGFSQRIGTAKSDTVIYVNLGQPILL